MCPIDDEKKLNSSSMAFFHASTYALLIALQNMSLVQKHESDL
jgi:hypothetical protein